MAMHPPREKSVVLEVFELLRDHCTDGPEGRQRFVQQCNAVLNSTALVAEQTAAASWARSWDKPLYANQRAQRATEVAERIRRTPELFADPTRLPDDPECLRGLRAPRLKLARVHLLGQEWGRLHRLHQQTATAALRLLATGDRAFCVAETRRLLGVPGYRGRNTTGTLFDALTQIPGIGPITSLHLLTDLGYPVYKPDRWVVRFAAVDPTCRSEVHRSLRSETDQQRSDAGYLLRHLDLVCSAVDLLTEQFLQGEAPDQVTMSSTDFRAFRFVDLMVAKFGMQPEESFGLKISAKEWLLRARPEEAVSFQRLMVIAKEMESVSRAPRRPRSSPSDGAKRI